MWGMGGCDGFISFIVLFILKGCVGREPPDPVGWVSPEWWMRPVMTVYTPRQVELEKPSPDTSTTSCRAKHVSRDGACISSVCF